MFTCDPKTLRQGLRDLEASEDEAVERIRKKEGGRPLSVVAQLSLAAHVRALLHECTAGDPMRAGVLWTHVSLRELSRRLLALGMLASCRTLRRLLSKRQVGCRTARTKKTMGHPPERNAQCETSPACEASMQRLAMQ